jgi:hypothetical protein
MKTNFKFPKFNQKSKIGAVVGRYDENGQYFEECYKDVPRREFPGCVREGMNKGYDISFLIFPKESIFVFIRNEHMDNVKQFIGKDEIRDLLDANTHTVVSDGELLWAYRNFANE